MSTSRPTNTSRAYWELKAEQVMDRVFENAGRSAPATLHAPPTPPPAASEEPIDVEVQVRYRSGAVPARLTPLQATDADVAADRPHRCRLEFAEEQFSITPGQAAVFYAGEMVLGGGLIQP